MPCACGAVRPSGPASATNSWRSLPDHHEFVALAEWLEEVDPPMDLDEVADELYEVPPEEFVALRKARQDDARADGDRALAADISALAKPSVAAWVCNVLVRAHREEIEGLVE